MIFISILTHKFDNLCGLFCDLEFLMAGKEREMRREAEKTMRKLHCVSIRNPFDASTTRDSTGSVVIIAIIFPCSIRAPICCVWSKSSRRSRHIRENELKVSRFPSPKNRKKRTRTHPVSTTIRSSESEFGFNQ